MARDLQMKRAESVQAKAASESQTAGGPSTGPDATGGGPATAAPQGAAGPGGVKEKAEKGLQGPGGPLPFLSRLQPAFGSHDVSRIQAHIGGPAADACTAIGASSFASGEHVAFAKQPPLRLAAHEAAHVIQQRAGARPAGGVGKVGDDLEKNADAVADAVVAGQSAEKLLARFAKGGAAPGGGEGAVQKAGEGSVLEQLRAAAEGNWVGDVDEAQALQLCNQLTPTEKQTVRGDDTLMNRLASAFNAQEILQAVTVLAFELKWAAHWIDKAGGVDSVGSAGWQGLLAAAPAQQQAEFIGWETLFTTCRNALGVNPILGFATLKADAGKWAFVLANYGWFDGWLIEAMGAAAALLEFGAPTVDPAVLVPKLVAASQWATLTAGLPRGAALTQDARKAIRRLADGCSLAQAKELFEIRFTHQAEDTTGATWTLVSLKAVWDTLDLLPDQDVTSNTILTTFQAIAGNISYAPGGGAAGSIQMGQGVTPAGMPFVLRHEVGHTVHSMLKSTVDTWLQSTMGFWEFGKGDAAAKQWIADLGGYGTNAGTADKEKRAVELLTGYCGGGSSWSPAGATMTAYVAGTGKAEDVGIWAAMPADVKNAVDQSKANWYTNYQNWQVGPKGRYFMSYWYAKFCYLGDKAKAMVDILRDYAAMAPNELFADTYSTYFADPAGYNDHSLWGNNPALPADVKAFFFNNILERHPYTPPAATPAAT